MLPSASELHYFLELANVLNFSRASERIGISQPSLSNAIKRLEHTVGTDLFIRSKNGVYLTPAGKRLLLHSKQLLQMWDGVKAASLASHFEAQGAITIGCHPSVAIYTARHFLPEMTLKYKKIEINFVHDLSRKIVEGVIKLEIDLGIVVNPIKHPDLIIQRLFKDKVTFWQAPGLSDGLKKIQQDNTLLICDPNLQQTQFLIKKAQRLTTKNLRLLTTSNLEVAANLTQLGCGIGILPTRVAQSSTTKQLQEVKGLASFQDEICLIYRHENRSIKAIEKLTQVIKANLKDNKKG